MGRHSAVRSPYPLGCGHGPGPQARHQGGCARSHRDNSVTGSRRMVSCGRGRPDYGDRRLPRGLLIRKSQEGHRGPFGHVPPYGARRGSRRCLRGSRGGDRHRADTQGPARGGRPRRREGGLRGDLDRPVGHNRRIDARRQGSRGRGVQRDRQSDGRFRYAR